MKIIEKSLNLSDIGAVMSATLSRGDYNAYQFRFEVLQSGAEVSLDTFADIAVVFERADGKTGENRVSDGSVLVSADNRLIYNVPSSLCAVKGEWCLKFIFTTRTAV